MHLRPGTNHDFSEALPSYIIFFDFYNIQVLRFKWHLTSLQLHFCGWAATSGAGAFGIVQSGVLCRHKYASSFIKKPISNQHSLSSFHCHKIMLGYSSP